MKRSLLHLRTLLLGLVGLAFAACQDDPGPVAALDGAEYRTTTINGVELLDELPGHPLTPAGVDAAVIGPEGGFVETNGGRLTVPPGALAAPVLIWERADGRNRYVFGPSGLQFAMPATLEIAVPTQGARGLDTSRLKIAGASDLWNDWQVIEGSYYDAERNVVVGPVHHFSQYALCID